MQTIFSHSICKQVLACTFAFALFGCISDGPNKTGAEYLSNQGIVLKDQLQKIELSDFPLDTVWTSANSVNPFATGELLVGHWGNFTSKARMVFDITDTTQLNSVKDSGALRLSLGFRQYSKSNSALFNPIKNLADSIVTLRVTTWAKPESLIASHHSDTLHYWSYRFIRKLDTLSMLPFTSSSTVFDTIQLSLKRFKGGTDSLQAVLLPNLRKQLLTNSQQIHWTLFMEMEVIDTLNKVPMILRLSSGNNDAAGSSPRLLFGEPKVTTEQATDAQKLYPAILDNYRATTYQLQHFGNQEVMLSGITQGMHFFLNRDSLMNRIKMAFEAKSLPYLADDINAEFNSNYFIPYASMQFAFDSVKIEDSLKLDMRMISDLDSSIVPKDLLRIRSTKRIALNDSLRFPIYNKFNSYEASDTITAKYEKVKTDSSLRRLTLLLKTDTVFNDTVILHSGIKTHFALSAQRIRNSVINFSVIPSNDTVAISWTLNLKGIIEPNEYSKIATDTLTTYGPRYLSEGNNSQVTLRVTNGLQRLLNRTQSGKNIQTEFYLEPLPLAIDPTAPVKTSYSVMGEIPIRPAMGKPKVNMILYLFPLRRLP